MEASAFLEHLRLRVQFPLLLTQQQTEIGLYNPILYYYTVHSKVSSHPWHCLSLKFHTGPLELVLMLPFKPKSTHTTDLYTWPIPACFLLTDCHFLCWLTERRASSALRAARAFFPFVFLPTFSLNLSYGLLWYTLYSPWRPQCPACPRPSATVGRAVACAHLPSL